MKLTLLAGITLAARAASRFADQFEGAAPPACLSRQQGQRASEHHRHSITLAQEWHRALMLGRARRGPPSRTSSGPPGRG